MMGTRLVMTNSLSRFILKASPGLLEPGTLELQGLRGSPISPLAPSQFQNFFWRPSELVMTNYCQVF